MPDFFQQPPQSTWTQQRLAQPGHQRQQQQQDAYETPAQQRLLQQPKQTSGASAQEHSGAASDASPAPDQAGTSALAADAGRRQASKSLTLGLPRPGSWGAAAAASSGAEDDSAEGWGGAGPSRRKGNVLTSQRASAQPYGPKTAYAKSMAAKQGGAAAVNPLQTGRFGSRPPRPSGPFGAMLMPPAAPGGAVGSRQQHSAGPDVFLSAAWNTRQARGANRPLTPWAQLPGEPGAACAGPAQADMCPVQPAETSCGWTEAA